jgi:hypothetical protein
MEEWNKLVLLLEDEQDDPRSFQNLAKSIFQWLVTHKIKDMRKFEQRVGPDYEKIVDELGMESKDLLENDEFFELSLKLRKKYKI